MSKFLKWPHQLPAMDDELLLEKCSRAHDAFGVACRRLRIPENLTPYLTMLYVPLAYWLGQERRAIDRPLVVGITGGQGSGKSTLSYLLSVVMEEAFGLRCATLSIDDIYKTRAERQQMALDVHPLFATRGVPGTHDTQLGLSTIGALKAGVGAIQLPSFDKAIDDRRPREEWRLVNAPVDFILFEGWCVGARAQDERELDSPINELESREDADGRWRGAVNAELSGPYSKLFALIDVQVMLHVGSMERVYEWRRLQEHKLRQAIAEDSASQSSLRIMSDSQVNRFIMHYERITRHLLTEMPAHADLTLWLDETHNAARMQTNRC